MKRKLIQLSPSTIVTSLPSAWVKKNALEKGNEIELSEIDNNILISTKAKKRNTKITINAKTFSEELFFLHADSTYIAGYDEITILFSGKEQEELIKYIAAEVPGMIITKQTSSEVVFKDITGDHAEDVNQIINRIFNMNISMLEDAITAIEEKEWIVVRKLKRRDYIMGSYISYCQRLINKYGYSTFSKTGLLVNYLKILEIIADKYCAMCKTIAKQEINAKTELRQIAEMYRKIQRVHESYSEKKVIEIDDLRQTITTKNTAISFDIQSIKELFFDLLEVEVQFQL